MWSFLTLSKSVPNRRKAMKRIDAYIAKHSFISALVPLVGFALIFSLIKLEQEPPNSFYGFGSLLLLATASRIILLLTFADQYSLRPSKWRFFFLGMTLFQLLIWQLFVYALTHNQALPITEQIVWLFEATLAIYALQVFRPYLGYLMIYLGVLFAGLILASATSFEQIVLIKTTILALFGVYCLNIGLIGNRNYWASDQRKRKKESEIRNLSFELHEVASKNRNYSDFVVQIMHIVRGPLNGVLGLIKLVQDSGLTSEQKSLVNIIGQSGQSLVNLVKDVEDLAKLKEGMVKQQESIFNFRKMSEAVFAEVGGYAHERGLELSYMFSPQVPERIRQDAQLMSQLLTNLVKLAVQYCASGEVVVHIKDINGKLNIAVSFTELEDDQQEFLDLMGQVESEHFDHGFDSSLVGLEVAWRISHLIGGEISTYQLKNHYGFSLNVEYEASNMQSSSIAVPKLFNGLSMAVVGLPQYGSNALIAEFTQWGMKCEQVTLAKTQGVYDYAMLNIPVQAHLIDVTLLSLNAFLKNNQIKHPLLFCSQIHEGDLDQFKGRAIVIHKPVARDQLLELLTQESKQEQDVTQVPNCQVLVAENNIANQQLIKDMMGSLGVNVRVVSNGFEAINLMGSQEFDLVFMDAALPKLNGIEATKKIRDLEVGADHVPIVALTMGQDGERDTACLAAGMDDLITKPIKIDDLSAAIRRWIH